MLSKCDASEWFLLAAAEADVFLGLHCFMPIHYCEEASCFSSHFAQIYLHRQQSLDEQCLLFLVGTRAKINKLSFEIDPSPGKSKTLP